MGAIADADAQRESRWWWWWWRRRASSRDDDDQDGGRWWRCEIFRVCGEEEEIDDFDDDGDDDDDVRKQQQKRKTKPRQRREEDRSATARLAGSIHLQGIRLVDKQIAPVRAIRRCHVPRPAIREFRRLREVPRRAVRDRGRVLRISLGDRRPAERERARRGDQVGDGGGGLEGAMGGGGGFGAAAVRRGGRDMGDPVAVEAVERDGAISCGDLDGRIGGDDNR